MALTPAGEVPIANAFTDSDSVIAEVGGNTRRITPLAFAEVVAAQVATVAPFDTITAETEADALATAADALATAADATQTALDRVATGQDVVTSTDLLASTEVVRDATALIAAISGAYRDTTIVAAKAQGVAALAVGQTFAAAADDVDYIGLYLIETGPVAAEIVQLPIADALRALQAKFPDIAPGGYAWAVVDQDGKAALGVDDEGSVRALSGIFDEFQSDSVTVGDVASVTSPSIEYAWSISDQDGKIALGVDGQGGVHADDFTATNLNGVSVAAIIAGSTGSTASAGYFASDIVHIPLYGQSLSNGVSVPSLLTTTQRFDSLMFIGGVRAQDTVTGKYDSLTPLIESEITPAEGEAAGTFARETPGGGLSDRIKEMILAENGLAFTDHNYQVLVSAPGRGATAIVNLSKPSVLYTRLLADVQAGYDRAQDLGKTFSVPAVAWLQGESDFAATAAAYSTALQQLQSDIDADVKAITGQTDDVVLVSYQTVSTGAVPLGQLSAAAAVANIVIAGPHYHLPKSDGTHFTTESSKVYGAYLARAIKRIQIDKTTWTPLQPLSSYVQGSIANVRFSVPSGALTFDTVTVAAQTNSGFSLVDSGGSPLTISSVTISGPDTVRVVADAVIPAGARLLYARTAALGNLRDSAGTSEIFDGGGINYAMHNWCVAFDHTL